MSARIEKLHAKVILPEASERAMTPGEGSLMSSASDDRFEARRVLPYLWHPVVVFACVVAAYLAVDVIAQQRNVVGEIHGDLTAVNMAVLFFALAISVFELANVVVSLFRLNAVRFLFHLLALALLIGAAAFGRQIAVAAQYANLYLFPQIYADCQQSAAAYGDQVRFRLCSARSDGGAYTLVVYDSGGEIGLAPRQRSAAFNDFLKVKATPVLSQCRLAPATRLSDHFYFVQSDCDSQPEEGGRPNRE
jgi:hypothetical protein